MDDEKLDQLARAAFDAFYAEGTPYTEIERAMFRKVVQAVMAHHECLVDLGPLQPFLSKSDLAELV